MASLRCVEKAASTTDCMQLLSCQKSSGSSTTLPPLFPMNRIIGSFHRLGYSVSIWKTSTGILAVADLSIIV